MNTLCLPPCTRLSYSHRVDLWNCWLSQCVDINVLINVNMLYSYFILFYIYLFEREHEQGGEGEAGSPWAGRPTWSLIPGPWVCDLSQRSGHSQMLNQLSHPDALTRCFWKSLPSLPFTWMCPFPHIFTRTVHFPGLLFLSCSQALVSSH